MQEWSTPTVNYSKIKWTDVANGTGVRISLFVSGCRHGCQGCFNPEAWSFQAGKPFTKDVAENILTKLEKSYISGLSLLGGEPLDPQNQEAVYEFLQTVKKSYPQKDIWCYTGYLFEELLAQKVGDYDEKILPLLDILVDGKFIQSQHNPSLPFRGSENQRIIRIADSLNQGEICLWTQKTEDF